jgi:hypothetical protein
MVGINEMERDDLDQTESSDHQEVAYKLATDLTGVQQGLLARCEDEDDSLDDYITNREIARGVLKDLDIKFIDVSGYDEEYSFGFFGIKTPLKVKDEEGILQSVNPKRSEWKPELIAENLEEGFGFQPPREPFMKFNELFRKVKLIGKYKKGEEANDLLNKQVEQLTDWLRMRTNSPRSIVPIVNPRYNWYYSSHPSETEIKFALFSPYIVPVKSRFAQYFIDFRKRNPREISPKGKAEKILSQL